ncbi:hypothetical protein ACWDA3_25960 [Nonomuraea rubra]
MRATTTDLLLIGGFIVWAIIAARLGYRGAEKQVNQLAADLHTAGARAAEQEQVIDQMTDALSRLLDSVIPVVPVTAEVDEAVAVALAALEGRGYPGRLTAVQAALEEAESEITRYHQALTALHAAAADPAADTLLPAMAEAAAVLASRDASAWVLQ